MANNQTVFDLTDRRRTRNSQTVLHSTPLNYAGITQMRARLAAINGARYTSAYLDTMTYNDMIYALRTLDDPTGI